MRFFLLCLFSAFTLRANASHYTIDAYQVSFSALRPAFPFSQFVGIVNNGPVHPMLEFGISHRLNKGELNQWYQDVNIGWAYHRFLQSMLPVYTDLKYLRKFSHLKIGASFGAGYLHSFPLTNQYLQANGTYEKVGQWGRPQALIKIGFFTSFKQITIGYTNLIQTPFVKSYVPLMPYNALSISYSIKAASIRGAIKKSSDATK